MSSISTRSADHQLDVEKGQVPPEYAVGGDLTFFNNKLVVTGPCEKADTKKTSKSETEKSSKSEAKKSSKAEAENLIFKRQGGDGGH